MVLLNNPIYFIDPLGDIVDPTTDKAKEETQMYGEEKKLNKRGTRLINNNDYEPAFGKIYQDWKDNDNIIVRFTTVTDDDIGGTISYDGENEEGQKIYSVIWNPNLTDELGASGIFEETFHLMEAIEGEKLAFTRPGGGTDGLDIYDEVRAKQWVANNIKSVKTQVKLKNDKNESGVFYGYTHYGFVKKLNDKELIKKNLMKGAEELEAKDRSSNMSSGNTFGGKYKPYRPMGFKGKKYSEFHPHERKPKQ